MASCEPATISRLRLRVTGAVQGVGFRPFVHGLAHRYALGGFVRNDARGVLMEIEGEAVEDFVAALGREPPPLARIDSLTCETIAPISEAEFRIEESRDGRTQTRITPDAAVCEDCLDDLFDPSSRFYLYPFVNCTHCGPRYTLTKHLPYDRAQTSMARFPMCGACARDYADLADRRFHAQPIACPDCGPRLKRLSASLKARGPSPGLDREPSASLIADIVATIRDGGIVALKGVGGYHLLCDARNESTVAELRRRKQRDAKPFAVMVANEASARCIGDFDAESLRLLRSTARPITVVECREPLAPSVAPRLSRIGVMLPYAPLHHLLFHAAAGAPAGREWREAPQDFIIVATSANVSGEPLIIDDEEAREKLAPIADLVIGHDRAIVARADDSVATVIAGAPALLRRARGFIPEPIALKGDGPDVLALSAHLKTTITVTRGREAFVSTHIGALDNRATLDFHRETIARMLDILDVRPELIACDLHPDLASTRFAEEWGLPLLRVQHHAAHVAAIAAEHGVEGAILGAALDGYGYGDDGGAWGGELMLVEHGEWRRLGHLTPLPLPGGDRAAREPWRMGVAVLAQLDRCGEAFDRFPQFALAGQVAMLASSPLVAHTTSLGRIFDAAAALLGLRHVQEYEGQAAMELEGLCRTPSALPDGFRIKDEALDLAPLFAALLEPGLDATRGSELFHGTLIEALAIWLGDAALARGHERVALGGGCLMNKFLAEGLEQRLRARGLTPLLARKIPANDGGLSLGQAFVARERKA
ncbi:MULTISPECIES: carbamoyltransferase HypF [Methylosinus]|uniref:Carbamoyltransferase HypF n=1 Tax=Methylosinus trichosporium (strain ATCC 35070 / NCIMB 11131 / UNIQEM 75 / OB3b) TaxID=595536 RepID=A0A2D2CWF8_METT3|nr:MULTISPECIES: carbamoyltransferase HypF [Methylosinus]ATQ67067.1 carbamoyltransferase HypF [Methylosinus trichosporium OB3b]OBS51097.1 carbamoyltransferase HypF [Methylosinus sp. 3S-1]